jgi:probable HAF family extracellular repeat protein
MQDLGLLPGGSSSSASRINDSGQIVGSAQSGNGFNHAFLYAGGTMRDLGTLGGRESSGTDINQSGDIAGSSEQSDYSTYAYLYSGGTMQPLGTVGSQAFSINDSDQVAGNAEVNGYIHLFLYSGGTRQDLGAVPNYDYRCSASAINNNGQIVGEMDDENFVGHAFLYSDGMLNDLNSLIDPASHWVLNGALDINNGGQIVGYGIDPNGQTRAFLLTPVPEPSTLDILVVAAIGLLGYARRRRRSFGPFR